MKSFQLFVVMLFVLSAAAFSGCQNMRMMSDEKGFTPLFDPGAPGLDGWVQRGGKAKYWVEDGAVVGETVLNTPNSFLCTEKDYANFILEFDVKLDNELNSGVQIRSESTPDYRNGVVHGYQVEIDPSTDPFRPSAGRQANQMADGSPAPADEPRNWSGGIYDEQRRGWLNDLSKNPEGRTAFRRGEWNHYRVEANGDSIKTWINGIPCADLHDDMTPSGFIALQVHNTHAAGLHVRWRNIRIKEL